MAGLDIGAWQSSGLDIGAWQHPIFSVTLPNLERRGGGWLPKPIIYLDEDGNPVDLEKVAEAVEAAVEALPERKAEAARKVSDRVLARLAEAQAASQRDIRALRGVIKESKAALNALDRAIEAQRDEEAALALLLTY